MPGTVGDEPWKAANPIIVLDVYEENSIDWDRAVTDPNLKAVVHRASYGTETDGKFRDRSKLAKSHKLLWGAYHLGLDCDPIAQADLLVSEAEATGAKFLTLDLEGVGGKWISLADAERFLARVDDRTGTCPALYANRSTVEAISAKYDAASHFAKAPLWVASFGKTLPAISTRIWPHYTLWQFASELNCPENLRKPPKPLPGGKPSVPSDVACEPYRPYVVPGTRFDMDVNIWNGDLGSLKAAFGGA